MLCLSFCLFVLAIGSVYGSHQPTVKIENGWLLGKYGTSFGGKKFEAFLGVPFAKPPVGELRFKEPVLYDEQWEGVFNASVAGSPCTQHDHLTREDVGNGKWDFQVIGEEDCLFLNVYRSAESSSQSRDVVVFIHGGAFMFGGGNFYGAEYIMDHEDIIYVSINYRLGPLGFLSTGDSVVPGNNGMKDQVAALQWIQRNIQQFGGNPKSVTITGMSAGGSSVHFHYLSALSKGLFHRGISYSGTSLCSWALLGDIPQQSRKLAQFLGCSSTDSQAMVRCLRQRPAKQIVNQIKNFKVWLYNPISVFSPTVEVGGTSPFMDKHPLEYLKTGNVNDLPWINSVTKEEGLYPVAEFVDHPDLLAELDKSWESIAPGLLCYNDTEPQTRHEKIARKVRAFYLGDQEICLSTNAKVTQMVGDAFFNYPAVKASLLQASHNQKPVYFYKFSYRGKSSISDFFTVNRGDHGVSHGDDVSYMFAMPHTNTRQTKEDIDMGNMLLDILVTFSKTGKPPKHLNWEPISKSNFRFLEILSPTTADMKEDNNFGNVQLWDEIYQNKVQRKDEL